VAVVGEMPYAEMKGDNQEPKISDADAALIAKAKQSGAPVVTIILSGRPLILGSSLETTDALLAAWLPGTEGQGVADVLFGDYNPGGRLPFTYPRTPNGLITYDHKLFETEATGSGNAGFMPQFEFGHGLSYTTFNYSNLRLDHKQVPMNGQANLSVTVTNSGQRAGTEVVLLYVRERVASLSPAGKRVKRFAKIYLEPGQSRDLNFTLRRDDLSFIGANNKPTEVVGSMS